jgi:enamine deaminase RidA (YjgF/YER057c/UK114 family)
MTQQTETTPEKRIQELGLVLPSAAKPVANYVPWVRTGDLVFVSGQIPTKDGKPIATGKVGKGVDLETAQEAARVCTLNALTWIREAAGGSLDNVVRVVKVTGFVAAAEGFDQIPQVINGCSDLLGEVFGERGRHARAAVGAAELPLGVPVEIEFLVEIGP